MNRKFMGQVIKINSSTSSLERFDYAKVLIIMEEHINIPKWQEVIINGARFVIKIFMAKESHFSDVCAKMIASCSDSKTLVLHDGLASAVAEPYGSRVERTFTMGNLNFG